MPQIHKTGKEIRLYPVLNTIANEYNNKELVYFGIPNVNFMKKNSFSKSDEWDFTYCKVHRYAFG